MQSKDNLHEKSDPFFFCGENKINIINLSAAELDHRDKWPSVASDLGLHCFFSPVYPNTCGKYANPYHVLHFWGIPC